MSEAAPTALPSRCNLYPYNLQLSVRFLVLYFSYLPSPSLLVFALEDQELPRVLLDRVLSRLLGPSARIKLRHLGDYVLQVLERVLGGCH